MESRKRKMPARAAARIEQAAKKGRTLTPDDRLQRSTTPASALNSTPAPEDDDTLQKHAAPPLPTSVQSGKPLPTVEDTQPEDLPSSYQSIQESGVLAESLSRSRQKWISDGLFEKYWTKPVKKKGVVQEDPKNPPKDSMTKIGQVTISLEPHYFEATMYAVKDPNKPAPQPVFRPILQYGPPNGAMPPPPPPPSSSKPATPTTASAPAQAPNNAPPATSAPTPSAGSAPAAPSSQQANPTPTSQPPTAGPVPQPPQTQPPVSSAAPAPALAVAAPIPPNQTASPSTAPAGPAFSTPVLNPAQNPAPAPAPTSAPVPTTIPTAGAPPLLPQGPPRATPAPQARPVQPAPPAPAAPAVPGTDPIIVTLAEKANEDPQLRDLMKRVANGNAPKDELARFQAIIDQITAESKRKGASQGPSADRLFVDGKTVRYFADEVDVIISIILRTNPKQKSADLVPPANSNPLFVELVKVALDDPKILAQVQRISKNTPEFSDATDLKETLDRLKTQLGQQKPSASPAASSKATGASNGHTQQGAAGPQPHPQQALRSKGPPPAVKPDVSAVVFEFAGANGDRYLFPKFSIVEQIQTSWGPQVIASFLIVRKGSTSEYGGDPKLDYYQPVTIRISASQPRYLDYFSKVLAPQDEVKRYMEDIMDNMTRAEYVLLAMRLPKPGPKELAKEDGQGSEKENRPEGVSKHATPEADGGGDIYRKGLVWKKDKTMKLLAKPAPLNGGKIVGEEESYQSFIASVSRQREEEE